MLPIYYNNTYTPSSSPPSPASSAYLNSSSPPSSPSLDPLSLDNDDDTGGNSTRFHAPIDPLAGSYRAIRPNRASNPFTPSQTPQKKARYWHGSPPPEDKDDNEPEPKFDLEQNRQKILWEEAIELVFTTGERKIDLMSKNISNIPPQVVLDLGKIVVLPESGEPADDIRAGLSSSAWGPVTTGRRVFARTHTAPASTMAGWARIGPQGKTMSSNSILGMARESMDLFLGQNNITKLPIELWSLHNLTVLSLRNNSITYLPPEIGQLMDLQALNVAHNKLRYVPAELLKMKKLTQLNLFPNPFIPEPLPNRHGKFVSETEYRGPQVPQFTELALRVLLARPTDPSSSAPLGMFKTKLEQMYELPLPTGPNWRPISAHLGQTLSVCVPGSIVMDESRKGKWDNKDSREVSGIGLCPNPEHEKPSIFVQHAEERYTWESSTIVIRTLGGTAAVLWRGCLRGCLEFLGPAREDENQNIVEEKMEIDLDDGEVVQAVRFEEGVELDFDD
ncbi:hypothetical protein BDZ97DRAFT_1955357 [Flammula alnicola]|nr:hypothetical protein BDZ97DRAFT_1955357 [Flammula alnicola]